MTRFELATPRPPDVCATGLRYIPKIMLPAGCRMFPFKKSDRKCNGNFYKFKKTFPASPITKPKLDCAKLKGNESYARLANNAVPVSPAHCYTCTFFTINKSKNINAFEFLC